MRDDIDVGQGDESCGTFQPPVIVPLAGPDGDSRPVTSFDHAARDVDRGVHDPITIPAIDGGSAS